MENLKNIENFKGLQELMQDPAKMVDLTHNFISLGHREIFANLFDQVDLAMYGVDFLTVSASPIEHEES